jgi:predicted phage-related endonuclease
LKCHFDFVGREDGEYVLVEAKNYNAGTRSKFDPDTGFMPPADLAQVIHEATVFGCEVVYLAVLFGGQEFVLIRKEITDQMKQDHIAAMKAVWEHVKLGTTLPPEDTDQTKLLYPVSHETYKMASQSVESACQALAHVKGQIKALEATEDHLATLVQGYMEDNERLVTVDGTVLATWKSAKGTKSFDSKLFQSAMPDIYNKFVVDKMGSRRFLLK